MTTLASPAVKAIAMWDFSWLERGWDGSGYENWERALDELAERGYDAVRIDAFPHLIDVDPAATQVLTPVWDQHEWGSTQDVEVRVMPALTRFISLAAQRNIAVALSSWFRQDRADLRMRITTPGDLARAWVKTLTTIEDAGLLDAIWYVDLCNEWPAPNWSPFLYGAATEQPPVIYSRADDVVSGWTHEALAGVREAFPQLPLCFSFSSGLAEWRAEDVSEFDLLEPHIWMTDDAADGFYTQLGYDLDAASFDAGEYDKLGRGAEKLYRSDPEHWQRVLSDKIADMASWSRESGLPLVTTEAWAIITWKDGTDLPWGWVKELCHFGVMEALQHNRWLGISTSNFCGPQFRGMWDDIEWHRTMTSAIRSAPVPSLD